MRFSQYHRRKFNTASFKREIELLGKELNYAISRKQSNRDTTWMMYRFNKRFNVILSKYSKELCIHVYGSCDINIVLKSSIIE
jgi:hypothetical protein